MAYHDPGTRGAPSLSQELLNGMTSVTAGNVHFLNYKIKTQLEPRSTKISYNYQTTTQADSGF